MVIFINFICIPSYLFFFLKLENASQDWFQIAATFFPKSAILASGSSDFWSFCHSRQSRPEFSESSTDSRSSNRTRSGVSSRNAKIRTQSSETRSNRNSFAWNRFLMTRWKMILSALLINLIRTLKLVCQVIFVKCYQLLNRT